MSRTVQLSHVSGNISNSEHSHSRNDDLSYHILRSYLDAAREEYSRSEQVLLSNPIQPRKILFFSFS